MKHGSSRVLAVPLDYLRYYKLDRGGEVRLLYNDLLLVFPKGMRIPPRRRRLIERLVRWGE